MLPRHTNRRHDRPNDQFVRWFNHEALMFNQTIRDATAVGPAGLRTWIMSSSRSLFAVFWLRTDSTPVS